ncbi:hypothetical protein P5G51_006800 [Virgibacillus sp. 179-BFC.A HS]|uniref:Uncharacterized protein n=1 Tax=Tigheibacillus jepli TaxID=3035914 RepID=A0ABU5CFR4_9BACI|nr:hypothetical protein [Virgibacillus sp. 179-BFC.A HS]MDY0405148.1 hypothetical protein [Virgibacillus sp. 179-BFC.A HS]
MSKRQHSANWTYYEGMCFLHLFDFGDEWHFQVEVKKMIEGVEKTDGIVAAKGENPDQYALVV